MRNSETIRRAKHLIVLAMMVIATLATFGDNVSTPEHEKADKQRFEGDLKIDSEKLLDNYATALERFGVADRKRKMTVDERGTSIFDLDLVDKQCGDFCLTLRPALVGKGQHFGFKVDNGIPVEKRMRLVFWMKVTAEHAPDPWALMLVDAAGRTAATTLKAANTGGQWQEFSVPLEKLEASKSFDLTKLASVQFEAAGFSEDAVMKFDRIGFTDGARFLGVTDKPVREWMREARESKPARARSVLQRAARQNKFGLLRAFAKLYLNEDLEEANRLIIDYAENTLAQEEARDVHHWDLSQNAMACRLYYYFSERAGIYPGRMSTEATEKLLEALWERTKVKNDIHWARQSVWYLDGSENHDLSSKSACLVSSRIFMDEPAFKDRVYPDYGFGGGYAYMHAGYHGADAEKARVNHSGGMANLGDGKDYTAKEHYEAWVDYFKRYIRARAKHGFLLEKYSSTYSKHSWNMLDLVYAFSGDEALRGMMRDFADLYWAAWLQVAPQGTLGGAKCRSYNLSGASPDTGMFNFTIGADFAWHPLWAYWIALSDYELPEICWRMALDREGMGKYVNRARGIGEEPGELPRPPGAERSLIVEPNSRYLDYTYVTPLYSIGCRMWHPLAVHGHLTLDPWLGMLANHSGAIAVPVGLDADGSVVERPRPLFRAAQHETTLIMQLAKNFTVVNPDWFPYSPVETAATGVYVGEDWNTVKEDAGWVFLEKNDVYAAVRAVVRDTEYETAKMKKLFGEGRWTAQRPFHDATVKLSEDGYTWNEDRTVIVARDKYIPFIIQAGDREEYGSFNRFMDQVKGARLELYKTAVMGFDEVVFTPPTDHAPEMVFSAANASTIPRIGGKAIDYSYPMTFESPYMKSEYGRGIVTIQYGTDELKLDFTGTPQ